MEGNVSKKLKKRKTDSKDYSFGAIGLVINTDMSEMLENGGNKSNKCKRELQDCMIKLVNI